MPFKKFTLLMVSFFIPVLMMAQGDYKKFFEDGKKMIEEGEALDSINLIVDGLKRLGWAKNERDVPQITKDNVLRYERETYLLLDRVSSKIDSLALASQEEAKRNQELYTAARWSVQAREALERGDSALAIGYAHKALDLPTAKDSVLFRRTFGNAAYRYYKFSCVTDELIDLYFLKNTHDFIVLPTGNKATLQRETGRKIFFENNNSLVNSIAASPDGNYILTSFKDHTTWLWDIENNSIDTLIGHMDVVNGALFSPDGKYILSYSRDGKTILWDINGNKKTVLEGQKKNIRSANFSTDGNILTLSAENTIKIWTSDGNGIATLDHKGAWIFDAIFSQDGKNILTYSADKTAKVWSTENGELLHTLNGNDEMVAHAAFSFDRKKVLTCTANGKATVWDICGTSAISQSIEKHIERITAGSFSPDGNYALTASLDGTAIIWDLSNIEKTIQLKGHSAGITHAIFSNNGQRILTASKDKTAKYWDLEGNFLMNMDGFSGAITKASFSDDDDWILLGSKIGEVVLTPTPEKAKEIFDKKELN